MRKVLNVIDLAHIKIIFTYDIQVCIYELAIFKIEKFFSICIREFFLRNSHSPLLFLKKSKNFSIFRKIESELLLFKIKPRRYVEILNGTPHREV